MSWFRLDDKFHSNQKVIAARNAAVGLYVRCGTWSADQGTEGRIPSHVALMFGTKAEIARVSAAGLWQPTDYGYLIRDYLEYNLSNDEVGERREKRAEAGRAGGIKSGESRRSKREASASDSGKQIEANTNPDPTRPDPTPLVPVVDELDDSTCDVLRGAAVMYAEWKFASNPSACKGLPSKYKAGIVANMRARHQQAIVAHLGNTTAAFGADVQRHTFADLAARADDQAGAFAAIFQVLRHLSHSGVGEDHTARANLCPPCHHGVRLHLDPVAQGDIGADHTERPNMHPRAQTRRRIND